MAAAAGLQLQCVPLSTHAHALGACPLGLLPLPANPHLSDRRSLQAGAEMMARAYHTSYKLPVIVTRGNNVYGPHQFPEKMM